MSNRRATHRRAGSHRAPRRRATTALTGLAVLATTAGVAVPANPVSAPLSETQLVGMTLAQIERIAIEGALARHAGNVTRAAKELEVNPSTIYRKMERWQQP